MSVEIPVSLKRLIRLVMRGFYPIELSLVVDLMIRKRSVKEEEIETLMRFERKHLRSILDALKKEKLIKFKMRMETGPDGKTTKQTYYYINYKGFVNVVKYKLDLMRRKIETEERDSAKRSSFICKSCEKTFTDLEADQLCDQRTGEFRCSYCGEIVEEDSDALPKPDSRLILAKFNDQMSPLYVLIRDVEDIKIPADLLEPEPIEANGSAKTVSTDSFDPLGKWKSKDKSGFSDGLLERETTVNIVKEGEVVEEKVKKEQPSWLAEVTVFPSSSEVNVDQINGNSSVDKASTPPEDNGISKEVLEALLVHEKKESHNEPAISTIIPGSSTSDWGNESSHNNHDSDVMMNDDEDEGSEDNSEPMVKVGNRLIPLQEVNDDILPLMTQAEREEFIRLTQECYSHMYD